MKINFDYKGIAQRLVKNPSMILLFALLILILAEAWTIKGAISLALHANDKPTILQTKLVRVNFKLYESLTSQSAQNDAYKPDPVTTKSPFGVIEKKVGEGDSE